MSLTIVTKVPCGFRVPFLDSVLPASLGKAGHSDYKGWVPPKGVQVSLTVVNRVLCGPRSHTLQKPKLNYYYYYFTGSKTIQKVQNAKI